MTAVAIISVQPHTLGGLDVWARYSCGHEQQIWFPQATKRDSRRQIHDWAFPAWQRDNLCSKCEREQHTK